MGVDLTRGAMVYRDTRLGKRDGLGVAMGWGMIFKIGSTFSCDAYLN